MKATINKISTSHFLEAGCFDLLTSGGSIAVLSILFLKNLAGWHQSITKDRGICSACRINLDGRLLSGDCRAALAMTRGEALLPPFVIASAARQSPDFP